MKPFVFCIGIAYFVLAIWGTVGWHREAVAKGWPRRDRWAPIIWTLGTCLVGALYLWLGLA